MKFTPVMCVVWMIAVATASIRAQPEQQFRGAIDQLLRAGNYAWEQKREIGSLSSAPRRPISLAAGETMIGGYTRARFGKVHVVLYNREIAFVLRSGWRHGDDLTISDIAELHTPGMAANTLNHVRPLPHEVLELLARVSRNFRNESGAVAADIDSALLDPRALDQYLRTGAPPVAPHTRTIFGLPVPKSATSRSSRTSGPSGEHVIISIWENGGKMTRFSVKFLRPTRVLNGPNAGDHDMLTNAYIFDLVDIGTTNVDVPPEAKALFLTASLGR